MERRFNSYNSYFTRIFGGRVQKISIDAGFSCPNRDGKISTGGCSFCRNDAFNPSYCRPEKSIRQQIEEGIEFHQRRYRRAKQYLAYFQPYSNTYKNVDELEKIYRQALEVEGVIGIVVGTRPDCIDEEKLALLKEINKTHYVMIEYGVESVYDETLKRINRGHDFETAKKAICLTHDYGLPCGGHFIFGLPGESREMMINAADIISELPLTTVKFHQLQIVKGTRIEKEYAECPQDFERFSLEGYLDFFTDMLERLRPTLSIERFAGEVPPRFVNETPWGLIRNVELLRLLDQRLEERDTWQGRLL